MTLAINILGIIAIYILSGALVGAYTMSILDTQFEEDPVVVTIAVLFWPVLVLIVLLVVGYSSAGLFSKSVKVMIKLALEWVFSIFRKIRGLFK